MAEPMNAETFAKRLVRLAAHIPDDTWALGARWYPREAELIAALPGATRHPRLHVIAAHAALSPMVSVKRNRELTALLLAGTPQGTFACNIRNATLALEHGPHVLNRPTLPKVNAFACNLTGDPRPVTVDRWAARAAGHKGSRVSLAQYARLAHAYTLAAQRTGHDPRTFQAAVWIHTRGADE